MPLDAITASSLLTRAARTGAFLKRMMIFRRGFELV